MFANNSNNPMATQSFHVIPISPSVYQLDSSSQNNNNLKELDRMGLQFPLPSLFYTSKSQLLTPTAGATPTFSKFYYFEVSIHSYDQDAESEDDHVMNDEEDYEAPVLGFGMANPSTRSNSGWYEHGMVGWTQGSIGYHSDDGKIYNNAYEDESMELPNRVTKFSKFKRGDVCSLLWFEHRVYFAKNGKQCMASMFERDFEQYGQFMGTITAEYYPVKTFQLVTDCQHFRYLSKKFFPMLPEEINYTYSLPIEFSTSNSSAISEVIQVLKRRIHELEWNEIELQQENIKLRQENRSVALLLEHHERNESTVGENYSKQFKMLREMGFFDRNRWIEMLDKCSGDVHRALIDIYIEHYHQNLSSDE